jgi:probable aminopeptidase NPEPL1
MSFIRSAFYLKCTPSSYEEYQTIIIVGSVERIEAVLPTLNLLDQTGETPTEFIYPLSLLKEKKNGGDVHVFVEQQEIILCLPSSKSTRMNCPARPDHVVQLLKKNTPKAGRSCVILTTPDLKYWPALVSALPKAYLSFTTSLKKQKPTVDVALFDLKEDQVSTLSILAESTANAANWVDLPPLFFHVPHFVDAARDIAVRTDSEIDVIEGDSLMEMGLGGLWGVGKAALHPPALVVLRGPQSAANAPQMVWVGKGIVYDTGGLSLKPKGSMGGMKMDMGGAAAVLGAFEAAGRQGLHTDVCAVLCLAENAIGHQALRNDDIITLYSGKTVEINNTDAEGRLVLGDGVAYATTHLRPNIVIDAATLTGAQLVATGKKHAGIICNSEEIERRVVEMGLLSGDLVHPLPYCPEFFLSEFKSEVADFKNSVRDRANAQSSCAGHFVEAHLGAKYTGTWLHIDLAGPAFGSDRGTGFGVGLLLGLAQLRAEGQLGQ